MGKTDFELTSIENGVNFDMDVNGFAEKTGWITGDDVFLALDRNEDGIINNGGELFGDRTLLENGQYASSGFEALAEFDANVDGIINAHDQVYNSLMLWQDKNQDGISTEDELTTLSNAGIAEIHLEYTNVDSTHEESGSLLANISKAVFEDGTETSVGEFKFVTNKLDTKDTLDITLGDENIELSDEILALPNVRSIGTVHSLHYAMAKDETGTLQGLVQQFTQSDNVQKREELVAEILYFLCDATDIDPKSRGSFIDARQLTVLERFFDNKFQGQEGANPNRLAGPVLQQTFKNLLSEYYCDLSLYNSHKYLSAIVTTTTKNDTTVTNVSFFNSVVKYDLTQGKLTTTQLGDLGRYLALKDLDAFSDFISYFAALDQAYW